MPGRIGLSWQELGASGSANPDTQTLSGRVTNREVFASAGPSWARGSRRLPPAPAGGLKWGSGINRASHVQAPSKGKQEKPKTQARGNGLGALAAGQAAKRPPEGAARGAPGGGEAQWAAGGVAAQRCS